ncbi:MAG: TIGR04282 family arsenosugar biosynthesis glycosyltransferase [Bacteroidota bacterium]
MNDRQLLIFTKNPEPGKCKTRLAATIGNEAALNVYLQLLDHTVRFTERVNADRCVYYSNTIHKDDRWSDAYFDKKQQIKGDLGQKMVAAFKDSFDQGYKRVVIIGSDCAEINEEDIHAAFTALATNDVVIGPALDGGYYLLGMRQFIPALFQDKSWSTPHLINETIATIKKHALSFSLLQEKSDIDYEEDLYREEALIDFTLSEKQ